MSAEVEIHLDVEKMKEVIAVMASTASKISDISERGDYIASVADKSLEMKLEVLGKLRRVHYDLPSLTPDQLKFIDERLDNVEQAQDVRLTRGRRNEINLAISDTIPFSVLKEALFLLGLPKHVIQQLSTSPTVSVPPPNTSLSS